jgi:hypothetical protein
MKVLSFLISEQVSGVIIYFLVLAANIDYTGLLDYALKAIIGSGVWYAFKLIGEYYLEKRKADKNKDDSPPDISMN